MMRAILTVAFAVVVCAHASAQPPPSSADEQALHRSEAGTIAFDAGHYETALEDFRAAYALSHRAPWLYDIGRCADRLGHTAEALDAFEGYLRDVGDGDIGEGASDQRDDAEARVHALRDAAAQATTGAPAPSDASSTDPAAATTHRSLATPSAPHSLGASAKDDPPASTHSTPPVARAARLGPPPEAIALALISGALIIPGLVTLIAAEVDRGVVEHAPAGATWPQISGAATVGPVAEVVGIAALAVGLVGAVTGVVWAASMPGDYGRAAVRLDPMGIDLHVTF